MEKASIKNISAVSHEKSYLVLWRCFPIHKPIRKANMFNTNVSARKNGIEILERPKPKPESKESKDSAKARKIASFMDNEEE